MKLALWKKSNNDDIFFTSGLIGFGGFAVWFWTRRAYRLILRDEAAILNAPALFVIAGVVLAGLILCLIQRRAAQQKRPLGWYVKQGGKSHRFGGPLCWEDVLLFTVPGAVLGAVGLVLALNCSLDTAAPRLHTAKILQMQVQGVTAGSTRPAERSYILVLADWRNPKKTIRISVDRAVYQSAATGGTIILTTHAGRLGYEWFSPSRVTPRRG